jgi:putative ABC transport system permease protein
MNRKWFQRLWPAQVRGITFKLRNSVKIFNASNDEAVIGRNTAMQKWLQPVHTAWMGVATHKLRSFLTILGVVIGVAAVISLMSIGRGTQARIVSSVESLGSNLMYISPGTTTSSGVRSASGSATTLTLDDAKAIAEQVSNIVAVAPTTRAGLQVIAGSSNMRATITGVTPAYQEMLNLQTSDGDFITQDQYDGGMRVAVLGATANETLFPDGNAVGQQIRAGNIVVRVIGVLESQGRSMLGASDDAIYIPLTTLRQTVSAERTASGAYTVNQIIVSITDRKYSDVVKNDITTLLESMHRLSADAEDDFTITSQEDVIATITEATSSMTLLLGAIAAISLLVGGIGVMNIMLVSVIERTREIGIRKALGAQERDIWMQFLIEAGILTLTGGIIGVIVGWGVSFLIEHVGNTTTLVSFDIILLAITVSIAIGVFFGFYPAWQASRLNPIEALRSE